MLNKKATIRVRTPFGITDAIDAESVVKKGTALGHRIVNHGPTSQIKACKKLNLGFLEG